MTNPQEQFSELTRRTQENFKHLWEQWSQRSNELLKGVGGRSRSAGETPGNPEAVLDAVFDFAENLIAQQRAFSKQMLHAASQGQQAIASQNLPAPNVLSGGRPSSGTRAEPILKRRLRRIVTAIWAPEMTLAHAPRQCRGAAAPGGPRAPAAARNGSDSRARFRAISAG